MSKNSIIASIDSEALWSLCKGYDNLEGSYPGSSYEGAAIFHFYLEIVNKEVKK